MSAKHGKVDLSKIGKSDSPTMGGGIGCNDPTAAARKAGKRAIARVSPPGPDKSVHRRKVPGDGKGG